MTRTVIWETPENREEYAETPCECEITPEDVCRIQLRNHSMRWFSIYRHDWRVYRDIQSTAPPTTDAEPAPGGTTSPAADTEGSGSASNLSDAGVRDQQASRPRTLQQHETVGRTFKAWDGGIYRCVRWVRMSGFDMLCIQRGDSQYAKDEGETVNVSERAVGRTYHRDYDDVSYVPHMQPCNCGICEGRP